MSSGQAAAVKRESSSSGDDSESDSDSDSSASSSSGSDGHDLEAKLGEILDDEMKLEETTKLEEPKVEVPGVKTEGSSPSKACGVRVPESLASREMRRSRSRRRRSEGNAGAQRSQSPSALSISDSSDSDSAAADEVSDLDGEEDVDQEPPGLAAEPGIHRDLITQKAPVPLDSCYACDWRQAPKVGGRGFNSFASRALNAVASEAAAAITTRAPAQACPRLQPHQAVVAALLHPQSPTSRLLVDHPTGSGKTREMIAALDNFFYDPRPKVPIFPKEPVCRNFYLELLRWPNRYRDFFGCLRAQDASLASGARDWRTRRAQPWLCVGLHDSEIRELCDSLREVLEMKGWFFLGSMRRSRREAFQRRFPGEPLPAAPLRALRYTSAGGRHTELGASGLPASALLKVAFDHETKNVYSNKIVIMDEVHNLVRTQTQYGVQLERLRDLLHTARGMVLAGFTGTPILSERWEGRQLLDIVKGSSAGKCDEGYLSCFPMRPAALFPLSLPAGVPDAVLTPNLRRRIVRKFVLAGEPLHRYDLKRHKVTKRLSSYCSLCVHFGSLHDGKNGSRARILANMAACAPKLDLVAQEVAAHAEKALVLVSRASGLEALLHHLRELGRTASPAFEVATMDDLSTFNAAENLRGERFRVMVADAVTCSEGVNFLAVRRVFLVDVPSAPSTFVQSVGRAIRMYGHRGLPEAERTVTTSLFVATFPRWLRSSLGAWAFRAQRRHADPEEAASKARGLLRRLLAVGIKDLETLKARLDDFTAKRRLSSASAAKVPLAVVDVASFLEHLGLWDEAKTLREQAKARMTRPGRDRPRPQRSASGPARNVPSKVLTPQKVLKADSTTAMKDAKPEATAMKGAKPEDIDLWVREEVKPEVKPECKTEAKTLECCRLAAVDESDSLCSLVAASKRFNSLVPTVPTAKRRSVTRDGLRKAEASLGTKPETKKEEVEVETKPDLPAGPDLRVWARRHLYGCLQALHLATTAAAAVEELNLSPWTADEEALRTLARRSKEVVPALQDLRSRAVDRTVLQQVCAKVEPSDSEGSSGESSVAEFAVSDSEGEPRAWAAGRPKDAPLVLPRGWRSETFRKKKRTCREFVDPVGRRYRTAAEARRAIDAARARENLALRMRDRFATLPASSVG